MTILYRLPSKGISGKIKAQTYKIIVNKKVKCYVDKKI